MLNNRAIIIVLVYCLFLIGCEKDKNSRVHKEVFIDNDNFVKLEVESFVSIQDNVQNYDQLKYQLAGRLSGVDFIKTYKGIGVFDFYVWNHNILIVSLHGFQLYFPAKNSSVWVYQDENVFIKYPVVQFDSNAGKIYALASIFPDMTKHWIAIDIESKIMSKFEIKVEDLSNFKLYLGKGGAIAETDGLIVFINALNTGGFEFIQQNSF